MHGPIERSEIGFDERSVFAPQAREENNHQGQGGKARRQEDQGFDRTEAEGGEDIKQGDRIGETHRPKLVVLPREEDGQEAGKGKIDPKQDGEETVACSDFPRPNKKGVDQGE